MQPSSLVAFTLTFAVALLASSAARANGRFPTANQLVVDPGDPDHVVVRATYGTMISHDGGRTLRLICEQAIGATGDADPMLGLFAGGTMVAGVVSGLARTTDEGCTWALVPAVPPREYVVDVTVQKDDPRRGLVVSSTADSGGGGFSTELFETDDAGGTFHRVGVPLGQDFLALTVEVAPSNPDRVYVSGTVTGDGGIRQTPTIARSDDRGTTWKRTPMPAFGAGYTAWISAVDPRAPDRLYVRIRSTGKDRLLVSADGARTFRDVYEARGPLTAFALSPDGEDIVLGGSGDGVMLATTRDLAWRKTSDVHAQCLTWVTAGIYACGIEAYDHFTVGVSRDRGESFEALSHMKEPCPAACAAGSTVGLACTAEKWHGIQAQIGQTTDTCVGPDAGAQARPTAPADDGDRIPWLRIAAGVAVLAFALLSVVAWRRR